MVCAPNLTALGQNPKTHSQADAMIKMRISLII